MNYVIMRVTIATLLITTSSWLAATTRADNGVYSLRDEWEPIDRIVVSTREDGTLNPLVKDVVGEAIKAGVRVVIVDDDENSQRAIVQSLLDDGLINRQSDVQTIDSPHTTEWARDEAPITRFDGEGNGSLTGTQHEDTAISDGIIRDVGTAVDLPTSPVPTVVLGDFSLPLIVDGGDFMTTDGGKTLVTTSGLYDKHDFPGADPDDVKKAVDEKLKQEFGITRVIELEPLDANAQGYELSNTHVDLQVRTLPSGKVIVSTVPDGDPQKPIIDRNIQKLREAGLEVIEVMNAPQEGSKTFKSYTNALYLNKTVLIPKYNDVAKDEEARKKYDEALNGAKPADDPTRYKIVQVDSSAAIEFCGALRCAAREMGRVPSAQKKTEASSRDNPTISFDATTGRLDVSLGIINFLGAPGGTAVDPIFAFDPFLGATLDISSMFLDPLMSSEDRYAFVGGQVSITNMSHELFAADVSVFSILGTHPNGSLDMFGTLSNLHMAAPLTSAWLDTFQNEVVDRPPLLPDLFLTSWVDLILHSNGFTTSFDAIELERAGITGNAVVPESSTVIPEPSTLLTWSVLGVVAFFVYRRRKQLVRV